MWSFVWHVNHYSVLFKGILFSVRIVFLAPSSSGISCCTSPVYLSCFVVAVFRCLLKPEKSFPFAMAEGYKPPTIINKGVVITK